MNLITVDPNKIALLAQKGDKFVFKPEAEEALEKLLMLEEMVAEALTEVKKGIAEAGMTINPNFKGVIGANVKCTYRSYGAKYRFKLDQKDDLKPFIETKEKTSVDTKKVDTYLKEVGELPEGIFEADRPKTLSITVKKENEKITS